MAVTSRYGDCERCQKVLAQGGMNLIAAAASVGIEHGMTTNEMLSHFIEGVHEFEHGGEGDHAE